MKKLVVMAVLLLIPVSAFAEWKCTKLQQGIYYFTLEHSNMDARMPYYVCCCGDKLSQQAQLLQYTNRQGTLVAQEGAEVACGEALENFLNADPATPKEYMGPFYQFGEKGKLTEMECPCRYEPDNVI